MPLCPEYSYSGTHSIWDKAHLGAGHKGAQAKKVSYAPNIGIFWEK
jgi:hypothetical protein